MKSVVTLVALFSACSIVSAQTAYLCIPNGASGISWNASKKKWGHTNFNVSNVKHLLKKTGDGWEWSKFGQSSGIKCDEINDYGYLNCTLYFGDLRFNKKNLRYMTSYFIGYVDGKDNDDNTPNIEFGECSPL